MERIRDLAVLSVRRACGFAALAIATMMFGLISEPQLAFRTGALLTLATAGVLYYRGRTALRRNHRETELWYMLNRDPGLPEAHARQVILGTLRDVYLEHADIAAGVAFLLWLVALAQPLL